MLLAELQATSDLALVERMARGDERAAKALVDRHGGVLFALARSILHEPADAEEVTADAFLQAWRTAATFDPARASVGTWLAMITRSRALDLLRTLARGGRTLAREAVNAREEGRGFARAAESPERCSEAAEAKRLVDAALRDLPEEQRAVIELAYLGGLSQSEIAARLGVPLGTVKTRTLLGMRRLRDRLAPLLREDVA